MPRVTASHSTHIGIAGSAFGTQRNQANFNATVLCAAGIGVVVGNRITLAGAHGFHALALHTLRGQVLRHCTGALFGQALIRRIATDAIGMPNHFHHGLVVLAQLEATPLSAV